MEDIAKLLTELNDKAPWIETVLSSLGGLVVLAQIIIWITPRKDDDAYLNKPWVQWIVKIFEPFSPYKKK